jgi:hypothetical protein
MTGPTFTATGPKLTAANVQAWRGMARTAVDRAVCDVIEQHLDEVTGAIDWGDRVEVDFRSGERITVSLDRTCGHVSSYECAGCSRTRCMACDVVHESGDDRWIKTAVRWCPECHANGTYARDTGQAP